MTTSEAGAVAALEAKRQAMAPSRCVKCGKDTHGRGARCKACARDGMAWLRLAGVTKIPDHVKRTLTPEGSLAATYGVTAGETACTGCGSIVTVDAYPHGACQACHKPLHRRCRPQGPPQCKACGHKVGPGAQDGARCGGCRRPLEVVRPRGQCDSLVEPQRVETLIAGAIHVHWYEGGEECERCTRDGFGRAMRLRAAAQIPRMYHHAIADYWPGQPWRVDAERALLEWLDSCWPAGGRPVSPVRFVFLHGPTGCGKSVAAAYALKLAIVERSMLVRDGVRARWCDWSDIAAANWQQHRDKHDPQGAREARDLLHAVASVPLLVVDECGSVGDALSDSASMTMANLFKARFEAGLPTLLTGNEAPDWAAWLDNRVASRFQALGNVVKLERPDGGRAPDMRELRSREKRG